MSALTPPLVETLRPLLHAEIDRLPAASLELLHRIALQLELEDLSDRLDEGFDQAGVGRPAADLQEIIQGARAALRERRAS